MLEKLDFKSDINEEHSEPDENYDSEEEPTKTLEIPDEIKRTIRIKTEPDFVSFLPLPDAFHDLMTYPRISTHRE